MPLNTVSLNDIMRPEGVHMGEMTVDPEKCNLCGLCIQNCPLRTWEEDEDGVPRMIDARRCFSCYNCMVPCPVEAISIVEPYHVDKGFWATSPHTLPTKMPLQPKNVKGGPDHWNSVERVVLERRTVRHFKKTPVPDHLIRRVLEAGRFAPSAGNCQPWKFIVITSEAMLDEVNQGIANAGPMRAARGGGGEDGGDRAKAMENYVKANSGSFDPRLVQGAFVAGMAAANAGIKSRATFDAPCLIIILGDERAIAGMQLNIGICGQNMNLVANSLGIKATWIGFITALNNNSDIKERLDIKPPWSVVTSLILGYPRFKQEGMVAREFRPVTWFREGSEGPETEQ